MTLGRDWNFLTLYFTGSEKQNHIVISNKVARNLATRFYCRRKKNTAGRRHKNVPFAILLSVVSYFSLNPLRFKQQLNTVAAIAPWLKCTHALRCYKAAAAAAAVVVFKFVACRTRHKACSSCVTISPFEQKHLRNKKTCWQRPSSKVFGMQSA